MVYILENDELILTVDSLGAEIKSLKSKINGKEYMWSGDKRYWGRTAPVLFPVVGSLKNKQFTYQDEVYNIGQHGFARDLEHILKRKSDDEIWFELVESDETRKKYPFRFILNIGYRLSGHSVEVMWKVTNPSEKDLYFAIGGHPAFVCPIHNENDKSEYSIYFNTTSDKLVYKRLDRETSLVTNEEFSLELEDGYVNISPQFFDTSAYVFENNQCSEVALVSPDKKHYITVKFEESTFGLWSPEGKNAPFVCIEPWNGRGDSIGFNGTLEERETMTKLASNDVYESRYYIVVEP